MATPARTPASTPLILPAETAADLMSVNPICIREDATVQEAVALLTDQGFSAAPVIDGAGQPVGVVSRSDLLIHDREKMAYQAAVPDYYAAEELSRAHGQKERGSSPGTGVDRTRVKEIMTPVVFSVAPDAPARKVVEEMLALKVHRLFVVGGGGVLVGVVSATDILKPLQ